jgi:TolA-binding protein
MERKSILIVLGLILMSVLLVQCSNDQKTRIVNLEKQIASEKFVFDQKGMEVAGELARAYVDFADAHKDSPETPAYLYKAADLMLNLNKSKESLDLYNRIIYQYPDYEKAPECLFLMAYIYENNFQNYGKAKEIYEQFIQKYPTHDFADDASISIENMGKSPEELIRMFEEKNRSAQDTLAL